MPLSRCFTDGRCCNFRRFLRISLLLFCRHASPASRRESIVKTTMDLEIDTLNSPRCVQAYPTGTYVVRGAENLETGSLRASTMRQLG